jgi:hypothetical protein
MLRWLPGVGSGERTAVTALTHVLWMESRGAPIAKSTSTRDALVGGVGGFVTAGNRFEARLPA